MLLDKNEHSYMFILFGVKAAWKANNKLNSFSNGAE